MKTLLRFAPVVLSVVLLMPVLAASSQTTTAWRDGKFHVDTAGVIGRSAIVLGRPNLGADEAMPLGNGSLGIAVWSEEGLTAQLNRADTLPDRLSPGQVVVPGLSALTKAAGYSGRLDLYNGEFREQGGGITATTYVQPGTDTLVIDVTGAKPEEQQTAELRLWKPRAAKASVQGQIGMLSESWIDNQQPGASGRSFGSLSGITADGRNVSVSVTNSLTITVSFKPYADGHFRILVASPHYTGKEDALGLVRPALSKIAADTHRRFWNDYWRRAAAIRITSADGSGEYMENLRNIYLFVAAAEKGVEYPGSQAGVADMVSSGGDSHHWAPSAFWHWNLRMMVAANIGAGVPELNAPYFNLYRENLPAMEEWTKTYMDGRPGACVSETMRFNGQGIEYEGNWVPLSIGRDCDLGFHPYYNARTLSTGAEVSLWVWQQYLATGDRKFLEENYPVMASSARFLLAYQKLGADGLLHTSPSNAHETQWDVTDPTTDIAGARALYPATIQAAKLLGKDVDLVEKLEAALPKIPAFPRVPATGEKKLLPPSADSQGEDVIADSYMPEAKRMNGENIGLEPVWPYDLIGDTSPLFDLAKRTYKYRPFKGVADWSFDPIQAARLGFGDEVKNILIKVTLDSQHSPNGLAYWEKQYREFYVEQVGVVAAALLEALVQDYDGLIRIAPAIPTGWDLDGSVFTRGRTKVDVQVKSGVVTTVVIEAGTTQEYKVRNPWPGEAVNVISKGQKIPAVTKDTTLTFSGKAGESYLIEKSGNPVSAMPFQAIDGKAAQSARKMDKVQIGLSQ